MHEFQLAFRVQALACSVLRALQKVSQRNSRSGLTALQWHVRCLSRGPIDAQDLLNADSFSLSQFGFNRSTESAGRLSVLDVQASFQYRDKMASGWSRWLGTEVGFLFIRRPFLRRSCNADDGRSNSCGRAIGTAPQALH